MAMWHLYRMETDPNVGPVSLSCAADENPTKFTLYDSNNNLYDTVVACVPSSNDPGDTLLQLTNAGYDPSEWHS